MSQEKSFLQEIAANADAIKTARAEPIQQEPTPNRRMDFLRSIILDVPVEQRVEPAIEPVVENTSKESTDKVEDTSLDLIKQLAGIK